MCYRHVGCSGVLIVRNMSKQRIVDQFQWSDLKGRSLQVLIVTKNPCKGSLSHKTGSSQEIDHPKQVLLRYRDWANVRTIGREESCNTLLHRTSWPSANTNSNASHTCCIKPYLCEDVSMPTPMMSPPEAQYKTHWVEIDNQHHTR